MGTGRNPNVGCKSWVFTTMDFCVPFPDISIGQIERLLQKITHLKQIATHNHASERIQISSCILSLQILRNLVVRSGEDLTHEELAALSSAMIKQRIQAGVNGTGHIPICITSANLASVVLALRRYCYHLICVPLKRYFRSAIYFSVTGRKIWKKTGH